MGNDLSSLAKTVLYCKDNELLNDDLGNAILGIYEAGVCDEVIAAMFEKRKAKEVYRQAFHGTIPFKNPKMAKGDYIVGLDHNQQEIRSSIQYLNAHSFTVANSGAGKTTLTRFKILQVAPRVTGMWLFDLRKREFAILKTYLERLGC